jgi:hypothetical protein
MTSATHIAATSTVIIANSSHLSISHTPDCLRPLLVLPSADLLMPSGNWREMAVD